jgi:glycosyltransferase involved in cell wall biosynthesis
MANKVSILIPTYNREYILKETIECALAQDYPDFEIVICDNASTDGSWSIISDYATRFPKIKAQKNAENLGAVRNWVECLKMADGEYAKILWSDDLISKDFLSKTVPLFNEKVGFVYTATEVFEDKVGMGVKFYDLGKSGEYESAVFIEGKLSGGDFPSSPGCAIFRLKDLRANLLTHIPVSRDVNLTAKAVGNDLLIFLLTAHQYPKFVFLQDVMSFFRVHKTSITVSSKKGELMYMYQLAESFFIEKYGVSNKAFRKFNAKLLLSVLAYKGSLGISRVQDFYGTKVVGLKEISLTHLLSLVTLFIKRRFFKLR